MIQNKTIKVRMNALVHRLQINKNIRFQTRIMWKRRTSIPSQTPTRPRPAWSTTSTATPPSRRPSSSTST